MRKIKNNLMELLVMFGVLLVLYYSSDPVMLGDSNRYVNGSLHDPPLYSTIIALMQFIFGNLKSVIIFQTLIIGVSIIYFSSTLGKYFNLNTTEKILISIFLLAPTFKFYNNLLTEPLSYAFSLLLISFVVKLIYNFKSKNLIYFSIFVILLLLMRNQFIFLYPVILSLYVGILILNKSKKTFYFLTISFISIFLFQYALINLNKHIHKDTREDKTLTNSNKGVYFFTFIDSIYISNGEDLELFLNKDLQVTLSLIFKEMDKRKASIKYYDNRGHFSLSFKEIRNYSEPLLIDLADKKDITLNELKKEISVTLISANFNNYLLHIFKKFYDTTWLFIFVPFFILLASLLGFIKSKSNFSLLLIFLSIFTLANHSVVYLFGRVQQRYFIYTDFVILIFIFISFIVLLRSKEKSSHKKTST